MSKRIEEAVNIKMEIFMLNEDLKAIIEKEADETGVDKSVISGAVNDLFKARNNPSKYLEFREKLQLKLDLVDEHR